MAEINKSALIQAFAVLEGKDGSAFHDERPLSDFPGAERADVAFARTQHTKDRDRWSAAADLIVEAFS